MKETIAVKETSFYWEDNQMDIVWKAEVIVETTNGDLILEVSKTTTSPFLAKGTEVKSEKFSLGNVDSPKLGLVQQKVNTGDSYHRFPRDWEGYNNTTGSLGDIIKLWVNENISALSMTEDEKRQQILDVIGKMRGRDLDNVRKLLRLGSSSRDEVMARELDWIAREINENKIASELVKIAKTLLAGDEWRNYEW